eukprot:9791576-Lingulodinium_polyedra.AAC.1
MSGAVGWVANYCRKARPSVVLPYEDRIPPERVAGCLVGFIRRSERAGVVAYYPPCLGGPRAFH